jgi:hypothetical protein
MLNTTQATEAAVNNIYPPASMSSEDRAYLIPIFKTEQERIDAEWRQWLAHTYLADEVVGSDLETMVWVKVNNDAVFSVKNSRSDKEANYKELVSIVSIARGGYTI